MGRHDVAVLNMLSTDFRDKLNDELHGPILLTSQFMHICDGLDDALVTDLGTRAVTWTTLEAGEQLFPPNVLMPQAHCIVSGTLAYTPEEHLLSSKVSTSAMSSCGETTRSMDIGSRTWLCELAMWCNWLTLGQAESVSPSELLSLNVGDMVSVFSFHPEVAWIVQDYSTTLCNVITRSTPHLSDIRRY